jgi:hypothetical protein
MGLYLTDWTVMIRYLAEFKTGAERKDAAENTMVAYKAAQVNIFFFCLFVNQYPSLLVKRHAYVLLTTCIIR